MNKALSIGDIYKIFDNKIKCITYEDTLKYNRIRDLLYPYDACIILYILEGTDNGHFICVYKHNDTIVYFDSYGRTDKQIINSIDDDVKLLNDETYPHLTKLLKQANDKITINKRVLQDEKSAVCGRWCCFVIMNAYNHKNLNDLLNYYKFDDDTEANDKKILYLTHRYL